MSKLLRYLTLPRDITAFERSYLRKLNRVALVFFYLHLPVLPLIAYAAGNSPLEPLLLVPLVLVGPTLVHRYAQNPRAVSIVSGFTAMVMGGLLVHAGRGPMQIEMHFYFFVLLALLAVFANPLAIITAAVTVAVHHLLLWLWVPSAVFNYDASFWTVVVHAAFVVLESVAAVFVARSFFDNVIGLERIVADRTVELARRGREMRMVLDSVGQGFVVVQPDGAMSVERSAIIERWLGPAPAGANLFDYLEVHAPAFTAHLRVAWPEVFADVLPLELSLDQLPKRLQAGNLHLEIAYQPVGGEAVPDQLVLVISDVTADVEREHSDLVRREMLAVFERFARDRTGFVEFCEESDALANRIADDDLDEATLARELHTLKGNTALFGVESVAAYCQQLERQVRDEGQQPTAEQRRELRGRWRAFAGRLDTLIGNHEARTINVGEDDLSRVIAALRAGTPATDVAATLAAWRLEPVERRYARVAEQATRLASRLGKQVAIDIRGNGVRLDPRRWLGVWSAFVHAVRNAIDHGIEDADERVAHGKPAVARVELLARQESDRLVLEVVDDGRGIDWERVRTKARGAGLPASTEAELAEALFVDGISTRDELGELSGRGVGLPALRAAARECGGKVSVVSERGHGTRLVMSFPRSRESMATLTRSGRVPVISA